MKKIFLCFIILACFLSSCQISKVYVKHIYKKEKIENPKDKRVIVFASDKVFLNEFKKTFKKNYKTANNFTRIYLDEFSKSLQKNNIYKNVKIDTNSKTYNTVNKDDADYIIHLLKFDISSRVEFKNSAVMGINGANSMQAGASTEYCVIDVKVKIYDVKNDKEIFDFVVFGEASVFLFNFTKTLEKAKEASILHLVNYLKSGKIIYKE